MPCATLVEYIPQLTLKEYLRKDNIMADFKNNYQPWLQPNSNVFAETNFGLEDFMSQFSVGNNRAAQDAQRGRFKALNNQVTQQAGVEFMDAYNNSVNSPHSPPTSPFVPSNAGASRTQGLRENFDLNNGTNLTGGGGNQNYQFNQNDFKNTPFSAPSVNNSNPFDMNSFMNLNRSSATANPMSSVSAVAVGNNSIPQQQQGQPVGMPAAQQPTEFMNFDNMFSPDGLTKEPEGGFGTTVGEGGEEGGFGSDLSSMDMFNMFQGIAGIGLGAYNMKKQQGFMDDKIGLARDDLKLKQDAFGATQARRGY